MMENNNEGDGALSCWICLEEGPDSSGKPLVRDCSCRGSGGHAHLSCIIQYARQKSLDARNMKDWQDGWERCPNCFQQYQHELALDLAGSFYAFVDENYQRGTCDGDLRLMFALDAKIRSMKSMDRHYLGAMVEEGIQSSLELQSTVQAVKQWRFPGEKWIMPEAAAHEHLGFFYCLTEELHKKGLRHYREAIDIYNSLDRGTYATVAEKSMTRYKQRYAKGTARDEYTLLVENRDFHQLRVREDGENSMNALTSGFHLVISLNVCLCGIECDRLASKLTATSRRVYGPDHDITRKLECVGRVYKNRMVMFEPDSRATAVQYNAENDEYIVKPPQEYNMDEGLNEFLESARNEGSDELVALPARCVIIEDGTPVVCHGLEEAAHLNGKIGDVRGYNSSTGRYEVHLEDKSLKPVAVKRENVRIVFDLPAEAEKSSVPAASDKAAATGAEEVTTLLGGVELRDSRVSSNNGRKGKKKRGKKKGKKKH